MRAVILGLCLLVAASVFAAMFRAVVSYRRTAKPRYSHRSAAVELMWAAIPCLMLIACAAPAVKLIMALPVKQAEPPRTAQ
jgi:cytochrome c oxidase subunit II